LRKAIISLAGLILLTLPACGEIPRPFQPEYKTEGNPLLMTVDRAGMVVKPVAGLPPAAAEAFNQALIDALHREDVAAMSGPGTAASLVLSGTADAAPSGWDMTLALADARAAPLGALTTHVNPTSAEDPKAWQTYAASVAKSFAGMLQPTGAQTGDPTMVAIGDITGVPLNEGRALVRALEYTLKRAQVKVAEVADKPTHIVTAALAIAPPRGSPGREVRKVDVLWVVMHADKSAIGEIRQSNDVPANLIDKEWPEIALAVADSATGSITDLLKRTAPAR
jgi:hypothetical protein